MITAHYITLITVLLFSYLIFCWLLSSNYRRTWHSVDDEMPPDETPVLIIIHGDIRIGERRWDFPGWEDTYGTYRFWDDPYDDGQDWQDDDIKYWMHLPEMQK